MSQPVRGSWRWHLSTLKWRLYWNAASARSYLLHGKKPRGVGARLVADLERDGIARTTLDELMGEPGWLEQIERRVADLEAEQAAEIAEARLAAGQRTQQKSFVWNVLGKKPAFDAREVFARFALQPQVLAVVAAYFGLFAELRFFNVWRNFQTDAPAQRSQLWHRDREDRRILKIFVYLSDVSPGSGPLVYAPGTHSAGSVHREPASFKEAGHGNPRSDDAQMAAVVPEERWVTCLGARGTVVFCDTTGYHRGGLARTEDRLIYNCMFVSPAAECPVEFAPPAAAAALPATADPALAFAIAAAARGLAPGR